MSDAQLQRAQDVGSSYELRQLAAEIAIDAVEASSYAMGWLEHGDKDSSRRWMERARELADSVETLRRLADKREALLKLWFVSEEDDEQVRRAFVDRWVRGKEIGEDAS